MCLYGDLDIDAELAAAQFDRVDDRSFIDPEPWCEILDRDADEPAEDDIERAADDDAA